MGRRWRLRCLSTSPALARPPPALGPDAALEGYRIARIYLDRGDTVRARAELLPVQKLTPDWPAVLNLEAALALREGDEAGAVAAWESEVKASR